MPKKVNPAPGRFREIRKRVRELKFLGRSKKERRKAIPILINPQIRKVFENLSEQERKSALHLFSKDVKIRSRGLGDLADLGSTKSIPLIKKMLTDVHPKVRAAAIHSLRLLGFRFSISFLGKKLEDPHKDIRSAAIMALANANPKFSVPLLEKLVKDKIPTVRCAAILALAEIGSPHAVSLIKEMLNDRYFMVTRTAEDALESLRK